MATLFNVFVKATAILLLYAAAASAQTADKPVDSDSSDIRVLEERINQNQEKANMQFDAIENEIKIRNEAIKRELELSVTDIENRIELYKWAAGIIAAFIIVLITFIGYKTIDIGIKKAIEKKTVEELETSWSQSFKRFSDERAKELEKGWEKRFKELEAKWTDYEQSMKKAMAKIEKEKGVKRITDIPTEEFEEFIEKLEQVKQEREYSGSDWLIKARFEQLKGNDKNAVEYYTKAINKNQTLAVAYNNRAVSHRDLKKFKEAFEDHYRAIELAPNYYRSFSSLATTQIIAGKYTDALNNVEKALTLDLDDEASAIVYYQKFIIMKLLGSDTAETEKAFGAALEKEFDLTYDFSCIGNWLSAVVLPVDMRKFIEEKTEMLKKKIK